MTSNNDISSDERAQENIVPGASLYQTNSSQLISPFECPVCLGVLKEPYLTTCGHRFCKECIHMWLQREGKCCPIDNHKLLSSSDIFPDNYTRREIEQARVKCIYAPNGCQAVLSPIELENHIPNCIHRGAVEETMSLHCTFENVGCNATIDSAEELSRHLEKNLHHHINLIGQAYTQLLGQKTKISNYDGKGAEANCMWDPRPKQCSSAAATTAATVGDSEPSTPNYQDHIRALYERIVLLEQRCHEQTIEQNNLKQQLLNTNARMEKLRHELATTHCGGVYIWRVPNFTEKLNTMQKEPLQMYYSPGFNTSVNGYKFCLRLNSSARDNRYLTVLVHLMKSENDSTLDWPFSGRISFVLVHPTDPQRHLRETMMSRPELEAFRRPRYDICPRGYGYTEFVSISDVHNIGFLGDSDTLVIRAQIQCV